MNPTNLDRQTRAESTTLIVAKTDDGYRVCSPLTPATQFVVTGIPHDPQCTCPDFTHPDRPPEWQCKHIQAVFNIPRTRNHHEGGDSAAAAAPNPPSPTPSAPAEQKQVATRSTSGAQMLIKRSVSPDGRIDSLSVEFSCPVGKTRAEDIKQQAERTLKLQSDIVEAFLKKNGNGSGNGARHGNAQGNSRHSGNGNRQPAPHGNSGPPGNGAPDTGETVPAHLIGVGGMNGKWGRRLFINVLVNGQTQSKLFGTREQLAEAVAAVGFPQLAPQITEGLSLNLPCRVTTAPSKDGKYVNVERVFAASAPVERRG